MLSFFLDKYLDVEYLSCMINLCLPFYETDKLYSKVAGTLDIPIKKGWKF